MQDAEIELIVLCQMLHAGDEGLIERAIVRPSGKHLVDGCVVDHGGSVVCLGYRQAVPLHTRIEHPEDQIEDGSIQNPGGREGVRLDSGLTGIGSVWWRRWCGG